MEKFLEEFFENLGKVITVVAMIAVVLIAFAIFVCCFWGFFGGIAIGHYMQSFLCFAGVLIISVGFYTAVTAKLYK